MGMNDSKGTQDSAPRMGVGMHFACTLLGTAFGLLAFILIYQLFRVFSWKLVSAVAAAAGISGDFLHGAFTRRYPFAVLLWLV